MSIHQNNPTNSAQYCKLPADRHQRTAKQERELQRRAAHATKQVNDKDRICGHHHCGCITLHGSKITPKGMCTWTRAKQLADKYNTYVYMCGKTGCYHNTSAFNAGAIYPRNWVQELQSFKDTDTAKYNELLAAQHKIDSAKHENERLVKYHTYVVKTGKVRQLYHPCFDTW